MSWNRSERVGPLLYEELSQLMIFKLEDPRLKGVTLTRVSVTKDLRIARVYFTVIGDQAVIDGAKLALEGAKGKFKNRVSRNLSLRYMPEFEFHYDRNVAHADRIERIIRDLHKDDVRSEDQ